MPAPTLPVTSGLVTRYHAGTAVFSDTGATTPATDTVAVALWQDQVGTAHLTVKSGAAAPTYEAASPYNAAAAIEFVAASFQALENTAWDLSSNVAAGTMVVFFQRDKNSLVQGIVSPTYNVLGLFDSAGALTADFDIQATKYAAAAEYGYAGQLAIVRYDGSQATDAARLRLRSNKVDRALTFTGTTGATTTTVAAGLRVGMSNYDGGGAGYATCRIFEVLYYNRCLTDAECIQLEGYAATQYYPAGTNKVHCVGDSKTLGYPLHTGDGLDYPAKLGGLLPAGWTAIDRAAIALRTVEVGSTFVPPTRDDRDEWRDKDVVVWMSGTNDAALLATIPTTGAAVAAQLASDVVDLHDAGFRVIVATVDRFNVVESGQSTPQVDADAFLVAFNAALIAGDTGADSVVNAGAADAFADFTDRIFYEPDGIHWTAVAGVNENPSGNDAMAVLAYNALIADGDLAADPITPPGPTSGETTILPSEVTGLAVWLKTETLSALADGATIATWPDSSGFGRDATGHATPIYRLDTVNGRPSVAFGHLTTGYPGIGWFDVATTALAAQPITLFFLVRQRHATNLGRLIDSSGMMFEGNYGGSYIYGRLYAGNDNNGTTALGALAQWYLIVLRMRGATSQVRENDEEYLNVSAGTGAMATAFVLGSNNPGVNPEFSGDMAEFAAYAADLTDANVRDLYNGYWQPRFNLPANPKAAAPAFAPAAGTYSVTQSVTLSTTTAGASIRYTVDGSVPTSTTGTLYSGAIEVAATTTVKAIAYKASILDSAVIARTYTIGAAARLALASHYRRRRAG